MFPARHSFDLPLIGAERERVDDVAADAAPIIAERGYRFDSPGERPLGPLPDQRYPVAELGKGEFERLHRCKPIASIEPRLELAEAELLVLGGRKSACSALPGLEGKRGEREY